MVISLKEYRPFVDLQAGLAGKPVSMLKLKKAIKKSAR